MDAVEVIRTKRDKRPLSDDQIRWFIDTYTHDAGVADEQAAALLMAIFLNGMSAGELATWTRAMIDSGERLNLGGLGRPTVDKHSTGGVGDKVSLILCPLLAACGAAVPQLSGRGLGYTGGTLDKLEAIPGFRVNLTPQEWHAQLGELGCVISAAGSGLVPADRLLYALRDVTATIDSIPLIASSIMSKKIAEGTDSLVLDVKFGRGAFMVELEQATELARTMVGIGRDNGVRTSALLTDMNTPLGRTAGNALEVYEAVQVLRGELPLHGGPVDDLVGVTLALADEACRLAGLGVDPRDALRDGRAYEVWRQMVAIQGGDADAELPTAPIHELALAAPRSGYVSRLDALDVGIAAWRLGAGRARKEDAVSPVAGVVCLAKPGDRVERGQPILELHTEDRARLEQAIAALDDAVDVADEPPPACSLIRDTIRSIG